MVQSNQTSYDLIWNYENQFAYKVAKQVLHKPRISVWLVLMPILFLYYAHQIQQYKAGIHSFSKGLVRTKIIALDSALAEMHTGQKDEKFVNNFDSPDLESSTEVMRVRDGQLAEVALLKTHYGKLLRQQDESYGALIRKVYPSSSTYRLFLTQLTQIEKDVMEAVTQAYHPDAEERVVSSKMQESMYHLREEELKSFFA
jgi:hypothetical protein